jgi:hypothetical protein
LKTGSKKYCLFLSRTSKMGFMTLISFSFILDILFTGIMNEMLLKL